MKKTLIYLFFLFLLTLQLPAQVLTIELTFTAIDNTDWTQLDSIRIMNRTQGGDTVLVYPDTVLALDYWVGLPEQGKEGDSFRVFPNFPNPVAEQTMISLYLPEEDEVGLLVTDITGRVIIKKEITLHRGLNSFRLAPGSADVLLFTALWRNESSSIKILNAGKSNGEDPALEYAGNTMEVPVLKTVGSAAGFPFIPGDELLYIGYMDGMQSGKLDQPETSEDYTFQFATNIPCPGTPTVEYEGQVYNTIQVFSQCWMKENLNAGLMLPGSTNQTDNDILEKYCYLNKPDSCDKYGGLYMWNEMMQYDLRPGGQGICPEGWHIPTDEDWKVLEGAVDSQYGIGDPEWDLYQVMRGEDVALNMKATSGWLYGGDGVDLYGFTALPGGMCNIVGFFGFVGSNGGWWTSNEFNLSESYYRDINFGDDGSYRLEFPKAAALSVRCLKDD